MNEGKAEVEVVEGVEVIEVIECVEVVDEVDGVDVECWVRGGQKHSFMRNAKALAVSMRAAA